MIALAAPAPRRGGMPGARAGAAGAGRPGADGPLALRAMERLAITTAPAAEQMEVDPGPDHPRPAAVHIAEHPRQLPQQRPHQQRPHQHPPYQRRSHRQPSHPRFANSTAARQSPLQGLSSPHCSPGHQPTRRPLGSPCLRLSQQWPLSQRRPPPPTPLPRTLWRPGRRRQRRRQPAGPRRNPPPRSPHPPLLPPHQRPQHRPLGRARRTAPRAPRR